MLLTISLCVYPELFQKGQAQHEACRWILRAVNWQHVYSWYPYLPRPDSQPITSQKSTCILLVRLFHLVGHAHSHYQVIL